MYLQRANADGSIPDAAVNEAIAQSKAMGKASQGSPSTDQVWAELGPSNIGGRIRDVAADPTTKDVVYIATGSGGLWRSTDGGATLTTAWDHYLPAVDGCGRSRLQGVVWAGTGEADHGGGSAYYGKGIYKSTDDGATWTNMGLEDGDTIGQIVIDPRDDDRVFVAVMGALHDTLPTRGLFLTEDGGATWTRVIVPETTSTGAIDVTINKTNPDIMLATTWDKIRDEKSRIYGPHSYVYRSTDGGHTWANVHNAPLPQSETDPALQTPDNLVGRMGVDFSDSDPNRAYLISSTARGNFNGFFTSTDAGATWTRSAAREQPAAERERRVRLVVRARLRRPGEPAARLRRGCPPRREPRRRCHLDEVEPARRPARPRVGSVHAGQGLPRQRRRLLLVERERRGARSMVQDPAPARDAVLRDGRLRPGRLARQRRFQDNGSLRSWANDNTVVNGDWIGYVGGDGMMNRIDPTNDRKFYGCSQNGGCRGFAGGPPDNGFSMTIPATARTGSRRSSSPPTRASCSAPASSSTGSTPTPASACGSRSARTSPTAPSRRAPGFGTITALGTTTADPNLVYAGTDSGRMWVSRNAMAPAADVTWQELESPLFPGRWVTRITVDPDNAKVAWATFSGWRSGDGLPAHRHDERRRQHVGRHRRQAASRRRRSTTSSATRRSRSGSSSPPTSASSARRTSARRGSRSGRTCRSCRSTTSTCPPAATRSTPRPTVAASGRPRSTTRPELNANGRRA